MEAASGRSPAPADAVRANGDPVTSLRAKRLIRRRAEASLGAVARSAKAAASADTRTLTRALYSETRIAIVAFALSALAVVAGTAQVEQSTSYRPELAVPETLQPFLTQLEPGSDGFPLERQAKELEARLRELSDALRGGGPQAAGAATRLLDADFRGGRLLPTDVA